MTFLANISLCLFFFSFPCLLFSAADIPDNYKGLKFGRDTAKVRQVFPESERHRFRVFREEDITDKGMAAYRLIYKKGIVDSAKLYFLDNRFAMAVEYYFPGKEYVKQALDKTTARYGQFVGSGNVFWRRKGNYTIMISLNPERQMATVTYMQNDLAEGLRSETNYTRSKKIQKIDRKILDLKARLDSLEKTKEK
jgi:hypothetical protein